LKASNATSAKAIANPSPTARSSAKPRPSLTSADAAKEFAIGGPSNPPDPTVHAYRRDLADIALAGQVIASHYAEPLERRLVRRARLRTSPSTDAETVRELAQGEPFALLDETFGWAWGYAGGERRVGYVESQALGG
jgi:hypothetical protein